MVHKKYIIYFIIFFLISIFLFPQEEKKSGSENSKEENQEISKKKNQSIFRNFLEDEKDILTSPLRIKGKKFLKWGMVAITTAILFANDESIYSRIKAYQSKHEWVDKVSPHLSRMCQGIPFGVAGLFLINGVIFKDKKSLETGSLSLQAMMHSFVVIQLIKHLTGRTRPSESEGKDDWAGPAGFFKRYQSGKWAQYDAFASGHTITIFALATTIANQYRQNILIPVICYSLATLGGLSTITEDLHWLSDVFVGAVLGYSIAKFIWKKRSKKLNILPIAGKNKLGLSVNFVF